MIWVFDVSYIMSYQSKDTSKGGNTTNEGNIKRLCFSPITFVFFASGFKGHFKNSLQGYKAL